MTHDEEQRTQGKMTNEEEGAGQMSGNQDVATYTSSSVQTTRLGTSLSLHPFQCAYSSYQRAESTTRAVTREVADMLPIGHQSTTRSAPLALPLLPSA